MENLKIDDEIYTGAPVDKDGREQREIRCYEMLDSLGIEYMRADHERADTIEACHAVEKLLDVSVPKNLFLTNRQKTDFYLLIMPGDKPFKTKFLSAQIGSARLSFASGEDMVRHLDTHPGSATILGLMNDKERAVNLLIDKPVLECEYLGCHPCENTSTIKVRTQDILDKFLPAVGHDVKIVELPVEEAET